MIGLKTLYIQERLKRSFQHASYITFLLFSVLLILEISYRNQLIDFYKTELEGLNTEAELSEDGNKTIVIGDSFSAHPKSYVKSLKDSLGSGDHAIINAAVPGIGIKQQRIILKKRLKQYNCQNVFIQVYLGNDLIDYNYPISWQNQSIIRNTYWMLGSVFYVVPYINSRLKQFGSHGQVTDMDNAEFNPDTYQNLSKTYLKSSTHIFNDMFALKGEWNNVYLDWRDALQLLIQEYPDVKFTLLVFPHCAQVSVMYQSRFEEMGAIFKDDLDVINNKIREDFSDIDLIDFTDFIAQKEAEGMQMYYDNDPHLNLDAQSLVGGYLLDQLKTKY